MLPLPAHQEMRQEILVGEVPQVREGEERISERSPQVLTATVLTTTD